MASENKDPFLSLLKPEGPLLLMLLHVSRHRCLDDPFKARWKIRVPQPCHLSLETVVVTSVLDHVGTIWTRIKSKQER